MFRDALDINSEEFLIVNQEGDGCVVRLSSFEAVDVVE